MDIEYLNTEEDLDILSFLDDNGNTFNNMQYSGFLPVYNLAINTKSLTIKFQSDYSVIFYGFVLKYSGKTSTPRFF